MNEQETTLAGFVSAMIALVLAIYLIGGCQNTDTKLRNEYNKTMFEQGYELSYAPGTQTTIWMKKKSGSN